MRNLQTRRLALTRRVTRNAKGLSRKVLAFACESATHDSLPIREGPKTYMYRTRVRERVRVYARVRPRMRKGLKTESQSRRLARSPSPTVRAVGHGLAHVASCATPWPRTPPAPRVAYVATSARAQPDVRDGLSQDRPDHLVKATSITIGTSRNYDGQEVSGNSPHFRQTFLIEKNPQETP